MTIFEAIPLIMADMGAVGKDKRNKDQGFDYRGVDDVMNATQPYMAKHKVFVVPQVIETQRTDRPTKSGSVMHITFLRIKFTFYSEDGTFIEAITEGEGQDTADKSTNKAMAVAFKYALFQVFDIPTKEMIDPDATTAEPLKSEAKKSEPKEPAPGHAETKTLKDIMQLALHIHGNRAAEECIKDYLIKNKLDHTSKIIAAKLPEFEEHVVSYKPTVLPEEVAR